MRIRELLTSFLFLCCLSVTAVGQESVSSSRESAVVELKTVQVITPIRVKTITEKAEKIINPAHRQPVKTIISDGVRISKGELLATFVSEQTEYELATLLLKQNVVDANLKRRIAGIDNKNLDMDDQMGVLKDRLASLQSKLERQKSEPTEDDIRIVRGRLRIADMNYEAAKKDYEKDLQRFNAKMLSRAELDSSEKNMRDKEARAIFAKQELEDTENPPERAGKIRITEIDIETVRLEIEKLAFEIGEQQKISEIQKQSAMVNKERNMREIKEKQEDLEHISVKAPMDGFVSVNRFDGNEIVPGTRLWLNFGIMEIPDLDTIGFKGILNENRRQLHAENDKVIIRLNGRKDEVVEGYIKSISTLSHDLAEKDDAGWNRERKFGVKVFDIIIALKDSCTWLRPGMYGEADIAAAKQITGPVVPLRFVKQFEGKSFINVDGVFLEVTGTRTGGDFLLDDETLVGKRVFMGGDPAVEKDEQAEEEKRLTASGELLPLQSQDIVVPDIGWWPWPKITWLVPEETFVKKGDVVARLDPKEREKQVTEQEASVTEHKSHRDELEKTVEITRRNGEFNMKVAANELASAGISAGETLNIVQPIPVHRAEMNLKLAEIKENDQRRKVNREKAKESLTVSPAEFIKMLRELERSELKTEQARLNLKKAREGATPVEKSKARLNLLEAEDKLRTAEKQNTYDNLSIRREYERSKINLARVEKRLEWRREQVKNHVIYSPQDGLICYNKIFNNGAVTKVALGNTVGPRFSILSIPNLNEMELKVEVDEKYYCAVKQGMEVEVRLPSLSDKRLAGIVNGIDLLFSNRAKKDSQLGLYSSHEPLGEVIFCVRVGIKPGEVKLKPGLIGEVYFPFPR